MQMGAKEDVKRCTKCSEVKHLIMFNNVKRSWKNKDGSITTGRYYASQCKACDSKRHATWYKTPTGRAAQEQYNKGKWNRVKADPKQFRRAKKAARDWHRNNPEYQQYRRHLKPLMK